MSPTSYVFLALGLLLIWFPRNWLRFGMRVSPKPPRKYNQSKVERDPYDLSVSPVVEGVKSRNWLDLFRAMVGSWVVLGVAADSAGGMAPGSTTLTLAASALGVAVLIQMVRMEGRLSLFAPIFFLQGMNFGMNGGIIGAITMLGAWALSPVLPSAGALLFVQGAATLCLGLLLRNAEPVLGMIMAGLTWVPVLISVLLRKRLAASFDKKLKVISRDASVG
ncbi:MAG: hypothetical protein H7067_12225 [Burkholderiales bacterium]|nr:hypothetical protein [Opitutaceae bacterium]